MREILHMMFGALFARIAMIKKIKKIISERVVTKKKHAHPVPTK